MKSFETKITLRLYDVEFIGNLESVYKASGERYESKNHFLTELIKLGLAEKLKADAEKRERVIGCDCSEQLKQIIHMVGDIHFCNKAQVERLMAHLQISEKLSSAIYNMLMAITDNDIISAKQVKDGYYDDLPIRLVNEFTQLMDTLADKLKDNA